MAIRWTWTDRDTDLTPGLTSPSADMPEEDDFLPARDSSADA